MSQSTADRWIMTGLGLSGKSIDLCTLNPIESVWNKDQDLRGGARHAEGDGRDRRRHRRHALASSPTTSRRARGRRGSRASRRSPSAAPSQKAENLASSSTTSIGKFFARRRPARPTPLFGRRSRRATTSAKRPCFVGIRWTTSTRPTSRRSALDQRLATRLMVTRRPSPRTHFDFGAKRCAAVARHTVFLGEFATMEEILALTRGARLPTRTPSPPPPAPPPPPSAERRPRGHAPATLAPTLRTSRTADACTASRGGMFTQESCQAQAELPQRADDINIISVSAASIKVGVDVPTDMAPAIGEAIERCDHTRLFTASREHHHRARRRRRAPTSSTSCAARGDRGAGDGRRLAPRPATTATTSSSCSSSSSSSSSSSGSPRSRSTTRATSRSTSRGLFSHSNPYVVCLYRPAGCARWKAQLDEIRAGREGHGATTATVQVDVPKDERRTSRRRPSPSPRARRPVVRRRGRPGERRSTASRTTRSDAATLFARNKGWG